MNIRNNYYLHASPNSITESNINLPGPSYQNITPSSLSNKQVHAEANAPTEDQTPLQCFKLRNNDIFKPCHDYEIPSSTMSNKEIVNPVIEDYLTDSA
ncbi:unnamed protein product [Parnassius apollo]|uniref:(apollo) hypothetical protein n=1 Tax=Parnassius apollo TaxID=110799 RepID=A0A8S3YB71_PARAO|nr:unnamed protein product [Parnassius apollo]